MFARLNRELRGERPTIAVVKIQTHPCAVHVCLQWTIKGFLFAIHFNTLSIKRVAFIGLLSPYPFVQIELIQQRIIKPNEFRDAQPPHRANQLSLADGLDRFCQDHRGLQKSPITVHKNVGLVIRLLYSIGCDRRNNEVGRIAVCSGCSAPRPQGGYRPARSQGAAPDWRSKYHRAKKFSVDWDHAHHRLQGRLWVRPAPL